MAKADEAVFLWINGWVGRFAPLDRAAEWVVSDYLVPVSMALALVGIWFVGGSQAVRQRHQVGVLVALTSLGLASWGVQIINSLYDRPRPFLEHDVNLLFYQPTDPSFPSNPVAVTFAVGAALWTVNRRAGWVLLAVAGVYGLARVYAGVHYPLDIVGSAVVAVVAAALAIGMWTLLRPVSTVVVKAARIMCLA